MTKPNQKDYNSSSEYRQAMIIYLQDQQQMKPEEQNDEVCSSSAGLYKEGTIQLFELAKQNDLLPLFKERHIYQYRTGDVLKVTNIEATEQASFLVTVSNSNTEKNVSILLGDKFLIIPIKMVGGNLHSRSINHN